MVATASPLLAGGMAGARVVEGGISAGIRRAWLTSASVPKRLAIIECGNSVTLPEFAHATQAYGAQPPPP